MEKKAFVVIGLGFGDEGKGLATDYLCSHSVNPLVIRFNGGHQAGHTVVNKEGIRHVFSCFGSGTFRNASTYWSNHCTFSPTMMLMEYKELLAIDVRPNLLIDLLCPVTTHYDILYNRLLEDSRGHSRHGSCGLGFGVTLERHESPHLKLYVQDLLHSEIFIPKLQAIKAYYQSKINNETKYSFDEFDHDLEDQKFINCIQELSILSAQAVIKFVHEREIFTSNNSWSTYIFEGAQGVLLDMDFGTWPHVTRSNTTSKNALELLNRHIEKPVPAEVFYVTRCYQTRHGAGPFHRSETIFLVNNEYETNQTNNYQGEFQVGYLHIDLLNYALKCDDRFSVGLKKHLLITCLDQLEGDQLSYYHDDFLKKIHYTELSYLLDCSFISQHFSFSPCSDDLKITIN